MLVIVLLALSCAYAGVQADYDCVCSNAVPNHVYTKPDTSSPDVGLLYEFECKPVFQTNTPLGFVPVMFENKVAYVAYANTIDLNICQGNVPIVDLVTTTRPPLTTLLLSSKTTLKRTNAPTTSPAPITTLLPLTNQEMTSEVWTTAAELPTTDFIETKTPTSAAAIQTAKSTIPSTTITSPTKTTTTAARSITTATSTTITIPTKTTTTAARSITTATSTTITSPTKTTTTAARSITTTTSTMIPTKLTSHSIDSRCPSSILNRTKQEYVYSHGVYCYEYLQRYASWKTANHDCKSHGGFLLSIHNKDEQDFVLRMLISIDTTKPVWLGLSDQNHKGVWQWVSGSVPSYKNWMSGTDHENYVNKENCAVIVVARKGQWDDVHCEGILFDTPATYPWVCQYHIR